MGIRAVVLIFCLKPLEIDDWTDYRNNDRYQWGLTLLALNESVLGLGRVSAFQKVGLPRIIGMLITGALPGTAGFVLAWFFDANRTPYPRGVERENGKIFVQLTKWQGTDKIVQNALADNDRRAAQLRSWLKERGISP